MQQFFVEKFSNGITLVGEPMEAAASAALSILVPIGVATDPSDAQGAAGILLEMFQKGAGSWNSRELSEQFEEIGALRGQSSGVEVSVFSCALLSENLEAAIRLYGNYLLQPTFPEEELEPVRQLALQDLKALEDEPAQLVMVELQKRLFCDPFGRSQYGTEDGVRAVSVPLLKQYYQECFGADRVVIGVAGKFQWETIKQVVGETFSSWKGKTQILSSTGMPAETKSYHVQKDSKQVQIALAYKSVSSEHPDYYVARVATGVLSGGMAGRLFIEVREKRGLVYRVSASHSAIRGRSGVFVYAGTTPERSQETLNVIMQELNKLRSGVTDAELKRSKADLKSRLIMQSESSSSRASAVVNDYWSLGRARTLEEIKAGIDAVTNESIMRHLEEFPVHPVTLLALGPKGLELET